MYRAHLERLVRARLEDLLLDEGLLPRDRIESAQLEQDQTGKLLSDVLVDAEMMDDWDLAKLVSARYGLPFIDVKSYNVRREASELLPADYCLRHGILPLDQFGPTLMLAVQEVPSIEVIRHIVEKTGCTPFLYVGVRRAIRDHFDEQAKRAQGTGKPKPSADTPAAVKAAAAARAAAPAKPSAAAPAAEAAPASSPTMTQDLPPLDLPTVSMRLDASVDTLGQPAAAASPTAPAPVAAAKPAIQRFQRTVGSSPDAAPAAAGPAVPSAGRTPRTSDPGPAPPPGAPRLASRAAPVLPAAASKPGPKGAQKSWESIFDVGESNVRRTTSGSLTGDAPKPPV